MAAEMRLSIDGVSATATSYCLQKFRLYETHSNFYMIGRDKSRTFWRVLKIDRSEHSELNILEDTTTYTEYECCELLKRIDEGNVSTGGLKFVTTCYGIIGFIKFLGPYYMLVITQRRKIGAIRGHPIYSVAKSEMIAIPNCPMQSNMALTKNENRYKKLLNTVDLTKDFYFSYSYNVMRSLQRTFYNNECGSVLYETMFVWNEYLTRGIRKNLKNTMWTIALVYGFFKQVTLSVCGRDFRLTLIARRSRHYAGTRYLKRGINEKGRVANDVETEQIVFEDLPEERSLEITSVVQNRGSIPLFWSQETSKLNIKPDITLSRKDPNYEATRLHFENLVKRYGNPIIILNLIKTYERKPRESILRAEFSNAIRFINKSLPEEERLRFLHWDLHKQFRNKSANVLALLIKVGVYALNLTGLFYHKLPANSKTDGSSISYDVETIESGDCSSHNSDDGDSLENEVGSSSCNPNIKPPMFQKGVLRTNCIDCLDRTNVAQYAYGLVALGKQLHALGILESEEVDLDNPIAEDLMSIYETMGDTLALQYGGSAAHNKIFSQRRGQWKAATQSQEFFRTLQRYYSNAYIDAEKQDAINLFLGYFQPQQDKPAIWELGSDQHHNVGRRFSGYVEGSERSFVKRSFSDGNIMSASETTMTSKNLVAKPPLPRHTQIGGTSGLSDSTPELVSENEISDYSRSNVVGEIIKDVQEEDEQGSESEYFCYNVDEEACNCSNFVDVEWLSSSGNSFDEDIYERSSIIGLKGELSRSSSRSGSNIKFPDDPLTAYSENFLHWVNNGTMLFR